MKKFKIQPDKYLTDAEKYLTYFWQPQINDKVIYLGKEYTIKEIVGNQAIVHESKKKIFWLQDLAWKPTIKNCDEIAEKFNAKIVKDQIIYTTPKQKCFFEKPKTVEEYREIIRTLRVLNHFQQ